MHADGPTNRLFVGGIYHGNNPESPRTQVVSIPCPPWKPSVGIAGRLMTWYEHWHGVRQPKIQHHAGSNSADMPSLPGFGGIGLGWSLSARRRMNNNVQSIGDFLYQTKELLGQLDQAAILRARDLLLECHRRGGRVFTLGNGGSASTAQHLACDLAKFVIPPGQRPFDARWCASRPAFPGPWRRRNPSGRIGRHGFRAGDWGSSGDVWACGFHLGSF